MFLNYFQILLTKICLKKDFEAAKKLKDDLTKALEQYGSVKKVLIYVGYKKEKKMSSSLNSIQGFHF